MPTWLPEGEWNKQTREERQFCADLYCHLRCRPDNLKRFVRLINSDAKKCTDLWIPLDENADWEIGVEVAFYRDWKQLKSEGSSFRKFDIALFSEEYLVIIEAKAHSVFERSSNCVHMPPNGTPNPEECELCQFDQDREKISKKLSNVDVRVIGLCSSKYLNSTRRQIPICKSFDAIITWKELYEEFKDSSFERADSIYGVKTS